MGASARATVYLEPKIYRAVKIKAATADRSVSDIVNEALIRMLREDAADLEAFETRAQRPSRPFEDVLKSLKRDRLL